ncbi:unnamed protein product, partial [Ectocarpus sp. 8 AP-2014]
MPLSSSAPGGQCEYRRALPPSFLFKFFIEVSLRLEALSLESHGQLPPPPVIGDADRSASTNFVTTPKPHSRGEQEYTPRMGGMQKARPQPHTPVVRDEEATGRTENTKTKKAALDGRVGDPVPHKSADLQVTGEAVFTDDMPSPVGTLFVGLVLSTKPHAKLLEVDPSPALEVEGVLRFVGAG